MTKIKTLGLALVAVFAFSAVAASAAQAGEFMTAGNTKITASNASGAIQKFTTTSGNVECNEVSGEATTFNSAEVTGENIVYKNSGSTKCKGPFGTEPTIEMNGCHYKFTPGETTGASTDETKGTVHIIGCNAVGHITVNGTGCTITVPEQTVGPVFYRNNTTASPMDVEIEPQVGIGAGSEPIEYTHTGFLCGTGTKKDGTYTGIVTAQGNGSEGITVT